MVRVLSDAELADLLDLPDLLSVVEDAFLAQGRGEVERPPRPHFPVGTGLDEEHPEEPLGTGLMMPAYIHGADYYATKLVGVHEGNPDRGLPTINAQVTLTAADTGLPVAYMAGTRITSARTGCIGGLAARELANTPVTLALVGAGTQARWQARAIAAATNVERIRVYSPSDSKHACASDLEARLGIPTDASQSAASAVEGADVVVTATTSTNPVFPAEALSPGALVVAIGAYSTEMQELPPTVFERASRVFADVPEEVAGIGDVLESNLTEEDLIPLATVFESETGRVTEDEILVVESVGSAVLDAAAAEHLYERAASEDVGTEVSL